MSQRLFLSMVFVVVLLSLIAAASELRDRYLTCRGIGHGPVYCGWSAL